MCTREFSVAPGRSLCCPANYLPQQGFAPAEACTQFEPLILTALIVFVVCEFALLTTLAGAPRFPPARAGFCAAAVLSAFVDDAVVYSRFRFTDPSKGLLGVWVVFASLAAVEGKGGRFEPIVGLVGGAVPTIAASLLLALPMQEYTRMLLVYPPIGLYLWFVLVMGGNSTPSFRLRTTVHCVAFALVSALYSLVQLNKGDSVELYFSAFKLAINTELLMRY